MGRAHDLDALKSTPALYLDASIGVHAHLSRHRGNAEDGSSVYIDTAIPPACTTLTFLHQS